MTITHDMGLATKIADRVAIIRRGQILLVDTPDRFLESDNWFVRAFLNGEVPEEDQLMTPAARIGLFMLVGMIILGVFIIKIEDIPVGERGDRLEVTARFSSVAGLDRKAAVRIAGVRVGKVEAVDLDGSEALLHLSLNPQVQLHEGASAQITSLGMLGDKYIEILPGDPTAPLLPPGAELGGHDHALFRRRHAGGDRDRRRRQGGHRGVARFDRRTAGRGGARGDRRQHS